MGEEPLLEALSAEMAAMVTTSGVRCCWGPWKAAEVPSIVRVCACARVRTLVRTLEELEKGQTVCR